jgi:hypothetical protein
MNHFGFAWAIASTLVYPIGVPTYYFYVLYTSREMIQNRADLSLSLSSTRSDEQYAYIVTAHLQSILLFFEAYEPRYWYWEMVETTRRLCAGSDRPGIGGGNKSLAFSPRVI